MPSAWVDTPPPSSEFDEFLALYSAFLLGKTSDPAKLRFRIQKKWDLFPMAQKKDFTDRLVAAGVLEDQVAMAVRVFGGTLTELV